ncbi:MAG: class I SAM-dependent methyltransferase [Myxococcaceae bacterium]|nr:class I SAM-dependent methyltransferase [Myxococcaceae bacterium]
MKANVEAALGGSYSSQSDGIVSRLLELGHLVRSARRHPTSNAGWIIEVWKMTTQRIFEHTGVRLEGKKGLDIGPGQQRGCLRCFSASNDMVAIDTDYIVQQGTLAEYAHALKSHGLMRTLKTFGRRMLGVDAKVERTLADALGVPELPRAKIERMSATAMTFPDSTFDFVYSHSVFEHIDDPAAAVKEVVRVLKPGGAVYLSVHQYTSHSGQHDPRILTRDEIEPPLWPHLRPAHAHTVRPNAYVNRWSLAQWQELFEREMPGVTMLLDKQEGLRGHLNELRAQGELAAYSDDDLLTLNVVAVWRKPS